jgi:hypothetical protein
MLVGILLTTFLGIETGMAMGNAPINSTVVVLFNTMMNTIILFMFTLWAMRTNDMLTYRELSRTPAEKSQEPEGEVTWNSLTPEQKQRAYDIFGYTLVNDFSRTKGGYYPLHAAISYTIFYQNVAAKHTSMTQHEATRLSLLYVNMILGYEKI